MFHLSEQQLAGQVLCIRNGKYLSDLEIEEIQRKIDQPLREVTDENEESDDNSLAIMIMKLTQLIQGQVRALTSKVTLKWTTLVMNKLRS